MKSLKGRRKSHFRASAVTLLPAAASAASTVSDCSCQSTRLYHPEFKNPDCWLRNPNILKLYPRHIKTVTISKVLLNRTQP